MEIASMIASVVSVILGIFAIGLSAYFFIQAKKTETQISNALESIKAQTDSLQKITARQLDRLTRYATDKSPQTDLILQVFSIIKEIPYVKQGFVSPSDDTAKEQLLTELISAYMVIYYYSGITNAIMQAYLPQLELYGDDKATSDAIKYIVDRSSADFVTVGDILNSKVHESRISNNLYLYFYNEAEHKWKPLVKDSTQVYADRAQPEL